MTVMHESRPNQPTPRHCTEFHGGGPTAVVVATPRFFDTVPASDALWRRVAGQSILLRNAVLLARSGVKRLIVISTKCETERLRALAADSRLLGMDVQGIHVAENECQLARITSLLEQHQATNVLLLRPDLIASAKLFKSLLAGPRPIAGQAILSSSSDNQVQGETAIWHCTTGFLSAMRDWHATESERLQAEFMHTELGKSLTRHGDVRPDWMMNVDNSRQARRAERRLVADCRKSIDGPVDRYLNRYISAAISRRLLNVPISPNAVSCLTFLFAMAAGWCAMYGTYFGFLAAALLMQCNSIFDCVDGELARARLQQSRLGQWLDTLSDEYSNVLFFGGLAWGASQLSGGTWLAAAGLVACLGQIAVAVICYPKLIASSTGDRTTLVWAFDARPKQSPFHRLVATLRYAVKKDFFILAFVVLALCGLLPWALYPVALGAVCSVAATVWHATQSWKARPVAKLEVSSS